MHAKSGLRVVLEWKIYRPDSVIAAVMLLKQPYRYTRKHSCFHLARSPEYPSLDFANAQHGIALRWHRLPG